MPDRAAAPGVSPTIEATVALVKQGLSIDDIATRRGLAASTVFTHCADAIEAGLIEARDCVELEEAEIDEILAAFERLGTLDSGKLAPVHEDLAGRYSYGVLRCLLAELS
jgi:ATP-dependent DNA helicase RecQ